MSDILFSLPEQKEDIINPYSHKTCRTCKHRERWECNSKVFQYCGVRGSNRTQNKKLKIKCKDVACYLYKEERTKEC
jgi:hypothetical protein